MKTRLNANMVGMVLGTVFGGAHLGWALLVAGGYAQGLLDWIFSLHFLDNPYIVADFSMQTAVMLVVVTFAVGYVLGWFFTMVWNWLVGMK